MSEGYEAAFGALRNLAAEHRSGRLARPLFREAEIEVCRKLLEQRRSLVVVGGDGAGKTAVIHGLAAALAGRGVELRQLASTDLVAGTRYLGEWQTKATTLTNAAGAAGAPLYFTDAWNLATTGTTSNDRTNAWDLLRPRLEDGRLQIIAECTPAQLRHLALLPGALSLLQQVPVRPLEPAQAAQVVDERARAAGVALDEEVRGALLGLSSRFLAARAQPGPALALLGQVTDYQAQKQAAGEPEPLSPGLVEKVLSVYSGLPRFVISRSEALPVAEMRRWFRDRIIGQEAAIEAVVETITLFKAGLHDPDRPIGSFLFVGPTGVGKTEVARALSAFVFGAESRLLRLDMSEYKDWDSYQQLIGHPSRPRAARQAVRPGARPALPGHPPRRAGEGARQRVRPDAPAPRRGAAHPAGRRAGELPQHHPGGDLERGRSGGPIPRRWASGRRRPARGRPRRRRRRCGGRWRASSAPSSSTASRTWWSSIRSTAARCAPSPATSSAASSPARASPPAASPSMSTRRRSTW